MSKRVRGTSDVLPDEYLVSKDIEGRLSERFQAYGYRPVDVPIIEYTELFLKKSGEERLPFLYDFSHGNRRLCLRPELTASVLRLYVDKLQRKPKPSRLSYQGPVFRYEKPQKGRSRQFTQMGIELIGAGGTLADAELISLACDGLKSLDLNEYEIVLGHAGVLARFLRSLDLEPRLQRLLLIELETVRKSGIEGLVERLLQIYPEFARSLEIETAANEATADSAPPAAGGANDPLSGLDRDQAKSIVLEMLRGMHVDLSGSRSADEIVDRLLLKFERQRHGSRIRQAVQFMKALTGLVGKPEDVLGATAELVSGYGIERSVLDECRSLLEALAVSGVGDSITLDFGLSRGLPYYTGVIFEIYHRNRASGWQLCGGGRYDDLVSALGGQGETPAAGLSFGIERLRLVRRKPDGSPQRTPVEVLIACVSPAESKYAIQVGRRLREEGIRVESDIRGRSVSRNLQYANKLKIPYVVILGSSEREQQALFLKHLESGGEWTLSADEAIRIIAKRETKS